MLKVKLGRPAIPHVLGCVALLGRSVNLSVVKVVISTLAKYHRLYKHGGMKFLVIYLKASSSMLQQVIGGQRLHDLSPFGARVGRRHGGLPSIIPALHRASIRSGCVWTIRFWATLFGLYRVLAFPGKIKLNTITDPSKMDISLVSEFSQFVTTHFTVTLKHNFQKEGSVTDALWSEEGEGPLEYMKTLRAKPFLIAKSGPSLVGSNIPAGAQNTSPASILASAFAWRQSSLYPLLEGWCKMTGNIWVLNRIEQWGKELWVWEDSLPIGSGPSCPFEATNHLGKLGFKPEPAGKVRVFAMVDPWTQWLFDSLQKGIFKLLAEIPQDGTFDQLRPIERLIQWQEANRKDGRLPPLYSFDLSAATDRIPVVLQKVLLSPFLTSWGAELWASLLVARQYSCPKTIKLGKGQKPIPLSETGFVTYATGQPMGALSSWSMLALVHHAFVQWAALKAGEISTNKEWFPGYAILGDDVVIGNGKVARTYQVLMGRMDVGIGDHKSLVSLSGVALEFAKRTFLKGKDVSMVPFAEFVMGRQSLAGLLELVRKYSLTLGQMLSVLGYGYRAKANASKRLFSMPKRLRNYVITYYGPGSPKYTSLKAWLPMKSVAGAYKEVETRVSALVTQFFEQEVKLLLDSLEAFLPLVKVAKTLGTVYRDREHYGTVKRGPDRMTIQEGTERNLPPAYADALNEIVYREAFLDSVIAIRDLRTKLEEISLPDLTWAGFEELWAEFREIETQLGALPWPSNIHVRTHEKSSATEGAVLRRWYRHSGLFRSTVTHIGE